MNDKPWDKAVRDATLAGIIKEMSGNASVHYRIAKFRVGQLLYNPTTQEDGFITHVLADDGVITYEVWVPKEFNSWKAGHRNSTWPERLSKLSTNVGLGAPTKN
jgi:hypothetical protein